MSSRIDIEEKKGNSKYFEEHGECTSPIADPRGRESAEKLKHLQNIFSEQPYLPYPVRFGLIDHMRVFLVSIFDMFRRNR